jgi:hypothetical protein
LLRDELDELGLLAGLDGAATPEGAELLTEDLEEVE